MFTIFDDYIGVVSPQTRKLYIAELSALKMQIYASALVHGLFQTEEYMHRIFEDAVFPKPSPGQIAAMTSVRLLRQEALLSRPAGDVEVHAVIHEAALRLNFGPGIMIRQLQRLMELNSRENVSIRIMLFADGPHQATGEALAVLSGLLPPDPVLLYREGTERWTGECSPDIGSDGVSTDPAKTKLYADMLDHVYERAVPINDWYTATT
jgi:hypothetical protein